MTASEDRTVKVWREFPPGNPEGVATKGSDPAWKCVCTISGVHERTVYDVDWCHQTGRIATACGDDAVRILEEEEGQPGSPGGETNFSVAATAYNAHSMDVNSVTWNPKERDLLASCSDDGEIKLWVLKE